MNKMKAFVRINPETQEVQLSEVLLPEVQPDEVLVKIEAFGVGIHDRYFIPEDAKFPYTIGSEGAGVITQLGRQVSHFSIGDRVVFTAVLQPQGGTWAEYAATKQSALTLLPETVSFVHGATVPIAGGTALECLRELQLHEGEKLFIAGGSGAIGTFLIQMLAAKGVRVSASASEKNHTYMKSLGAEETVDYHNPEWINKIKIWSDGGVDAALAIQPGTGIDSIKVVKDGGKLITVSGDSDQVIQERSVKIWQMGHHPDTQKKKVELLQAIANNEIRIEIEKEYSFGQALEALKKTETRHARGKVVVKGLQ